MPTHSTNAQQTIDPEFSPLACLLADCQPDQLLAVAWRDDELVVIVNPGQKFVYTAQQIYAAGWNHGQLIRDSQPRPLPQPKPHTPHEVAALEHVAAAHPGELAAAVINIPPHKVPAPPTPPVAATASTAELNRQAEADRRSRESLYDNDSTGLVHDNAPKPAAYPAPAQPTQFPTPAQNKTRRP
jgi:hypothetical protein